MKQNIKHVAQYIPYQLNTVYNLSDVVNLRKEVRDEVRYKKLTQSNLDFVCQFCKPILRPIQEVEQYFENLYGDLKHQDVTDYFDADFLESHDNIEISEIQLLEPEQIPYGTIQVLFKHHFDVFGLIEKGLAININTLSVQNDG